MAQGKSGRIVIDVEPEFKQELYRALALKDSTLKDWFLVNAQRLCEETAQPPLSFGAEDATPYTATKN